jgi:hypothetical protein
VDKDKWLPAAALVLCIAGGAFFFVQGRTAVSAGGASITEPCTSVFDAWFNHKLTAPLNGVQSLVRTNCDSDRRTKAVAGGILLALGIVLYYQGEQAKQKQQQPKAPIPSKQAVRSSPKPPNEQQPPPGWWWDGTKWNPPAE